MSKNIKKYLLTSLTLGLIAGISAGLIALTNFISKDRIIKNEQANITKGIREIFGDNADVKEEKELNGNTYTVSLYEVVNKDSLPLGYAFKSEGSNMYGKIVLLSGFDEINHNFISLSLIKNEQTYATTLVDNYVKPLNNNEISVDNVSCGATYGAKLIRDMINEAEEVAKELWK